tara:strand:- start:285 stop:542 length:258 start_codon:yes stop_codon:yes gene_type:complete
MKVFNLRTTTERKLLEAVEQDLVDAQIRLEIVEDKFDKLQKQVLVMVKQNAAALQTLNNQASDLAIQTNRIVRFLKNKNPPIDDL